MDNLTKRNAIDHAASDVDGFTKRVCPVCQNEFWGRYNRVYCSYECRHEAYRTHKSVRSLDRKCPICGREFKATNHNTKYCSVKCRKAASKFRPRIVKKEMCKESGEKSLYQWQQEAAMCGMSYGQYRAALSMGKTFEQLVRRG